MFDQVKSVSITDVTCLRSHEPERFPPRPARSRSCCAFPAAGETETSRPEPGRPTPVNRGDDATGTGERPGRCPSGGPAKPASTAPVKPDHEGEANRGINGTRSVAQRGKGKGLRGSNYQGRPGRLVGKGHERRTADRRRGRVRSRAGRPAAHGDH